MLRAREYGGAGRPVVLLHGGPGAGGYLGSLGRGLADSFRVFEPLQRTSGGEPLKVATHVSDLDEWLGGFGDDEPPALVGHSWGAMLALAYAAEHPEGERVSSLVLIGCGTFDPASRERLQTTVWSRIDADLRRRLDGLSVVVPDPNERLREMGNLLLPVYSYDTIESELAVDLCDARGHEETWEDMLRLQEAGVYPSAFAAIEAPVLMLHGEIDPHPGPSIRESLLPFLPQLEYREWQRCGHYPWLERHARDDFMLVLHRWLSRHPRSGVKVETGGGRP